MHHRTDTEPLPHAICFSESLYVNASVRCGAIAPWHPNDKPLRTRNPQMQTPTRRRFIEITPFACLALLAACSPKVESQSAPMATTPAPGQAPVGAPAQAPLTTTMNLPMQNLRVWQCLQQLRVVPRQGRRCRRRMPSVCRQECSGQGLVHVLGQKGLSHPRMFAHELI